MLEKGTKGTPESRRQLPEQSNISASHAHVDTDTHAPVPLYVLISFSAADSVYDSEVEDDFDMSPSASSTRPIT